MGRKSSKRPWNAPHTPLNMERLASIPRSQLGPGGVEYTVQQISSGQKIYTCPGCLQPIPVGAAHVVAWTEEYFYARGVEERRHWHTECWRRGLRPN